MDLTSEKNRHLSFKWSKHIPSPPVFHVSVVYVNRDCSGKSFLGHSQLAPVLEPRVRKPGV